jgi:hypothetical protein
MTVKKINNIDPWFLWVFQMSIIRVQAQVGVTFSQFLAMIMPFEPGMGEIEKGTISNLEISLSEK